MKKVRTLKYFLLETNKLYDTAPDIVDWYGKIDVRNIKTGSSHLLPKRLLLSIAPNPDTVFTDVICHPFLLVSSMVRDTIKLYEPNMVFKEIILLDGANELSSVYYLPILPEVDCLSGESELNLDRSVIKKAVISLPAVGDNSIFKIAGVTGNYIVVRLDLAESILRREARGIGLEDIQFTG